MATSASFEAIGVRNDIVVDDGDALDAATLIARAELVALDAACSRFRDDSELANLNRNAGRPYAVGELLFEAIAIALTAAAETGGLVDPTVGRAMRGIGYDRSFEIVVSRGPSTGFAFVPAGGWQDVKLDHPRRTVTVPRGFELDLGATAKAFAADRIADRIAVETRVATLVSLGGDIAVRGAPSAGWPVLVTDSHRQATASTQMVSMQHGGLATSSTSVRRWRAGGVELHHIVDPTTGSPAIGPWRTVSVAAATCLEANTASTAAIIAGDGAPSWLEARGLAARLVTHQGVVTSTVTWPND
jgi:thiamine biosynthesis lipoprotein ApbE